MDFDSVTFLDSVYLDAYQECNITPRTVSNSRCAYVCVPLCSKAVQPLPGVKRCHRLYDFVFLFLLMKYSVPPVCGQHYC